MEILQSYAGNDADLVAGKNEEWGVSAPQMPPIGVLNYRRQHNYPEELPIRDPSFCEDEYPNTWTWYAVGTPLWLRNIDKRIICAEHVERFSKRFLDVMDSWLDKELSAWSESFMPTVCQQMALKGQLITGSIAEPYTFRRDLSPTCSRKQLITK